MRGFLAAVGFLTVLPMPASWRGGEKELSRASTFFPLVGVLIGVIVAALDYGLGRVFPRPLTSVFTVIILIAASRGLHLDGLADTADGLFSGRPRERMLEIMRDSRTGPMGVAAVVCIIALKIAALAAIPSPLRPGAVFLVPVAGRCALAMTMAVSPCARPDGSLSSVFGRKPVLIPWAFAVCVGTGWLALRWIGLATGMLSTVGTLILAGYVYRKVRGYTGDTLGAACEIIGLVPLLVVAACNNIGLLVIK